LHLKFACLSQALPVAFVLLQGWHSQELIDGFFWIVRLDLFGIIVFILYPDVARVVII
jgi:hypothetical protein